eukprot:748297-Rhodomonas_salina.1
MTAEPRRRGACARACPRAACAVPWGGLGRGWRSPPLSFPFALPCLPLLRLRVAGSGVQRGGPRVVEAQLEVARGTFPALGNFLSDFETGQFLLPRVGSDPSAGSALPALLSLQPPLYPPTWP